MTLVIKTPDAQKVIINLEDLEDALDQLDAEARLRLLNKLKDLPNDQKKQLLQTDNEPSLMELDGLGKEMWQEIDVDEYIRKEREAWDG